MAVHLVSVSVSTPSSGPVDAGERSYWRTRGCWDVRRVISPGCTVRPSGIFTSLGSSPSRNALRCAQSGRSSSSKLDVQYIAVDITMFFCKRLENIWFIRDRETLHGFHHAADPTHMSAPPVPWESSSFPHPIPSERKFANNPWPFMSSTGQATSSTSSTSNIQLITNALADYARITGVELSKNPFAAAIEQSNSHEAILELLQEREKASKEYRDSNRSLVNCLRASQGSSARRSPW
jgi:hypothetical protein